MWRDEHTGGGAKWWWGEQLGGEGSKLGRGMDLEKLTSAEGNPG